MSKEPEAGHDNMAGQMRYRILKMKSNFSPVLQVGTTQYYTIWEVQYLRGRNIVSGNFTYHQVWH
jgi:hypothetical protein